MTKLKNLNCSNSNCYKTKNNLNFTAQKLKCYKTQKVKEKKHNILKTQNVTKHNISNCDTALKLKL